MAIKKFIYILISFVIVSNIILPTVILAKDEVEKTDNSLIENNNNEQSQEFNDVEKIEEKTVNNKDEIFENNDENVNKEENTNKVEMIDEIENNIESIQKDQNIDSNNLMTIQEENNTNNLSVSYRTHVQDIGWQDYVQDGNMSGTSGRSLRLEGINIKLLNNSQNLKIKYQVHVQNIGWQGWKYNDEMAGTSGQALRLEGIRIELENTEKYSIMYRVHVQNIGWQEWKYDGEMAGTSGQSLRLEGIEIKIIEKQKKGILNIDTPSENKSFYDKETSNIEVSGWKMANVSNTYIKAYIDNEQIDSKMISYYERTDVIKEISGYGTVTQNLTPGYKFNIDILKLASGEHNIKIDLYYENEILTSKVRSFRKDVGIHIQYRTHVQDVGWQDYVQDGKMSGTSGKSYRLEGINIRLLNNGSEDIKLKYQVHVQNVGWQEWKYDGEMAGTSGQALRLEGIKIELENSENYSIMYRVHVQNIGWQEWKYDGEMAGTSGQSLRLEAIEIKLIEKQIVGMICIDTPNENEVYYNNETSEIRVKGWKMANVSNTYIKAYIDNKEIDERLISYYEREDVIKGVKGYGTATQNPSPGYKFNIDISQLSSGGHNLKIELCSNEKVISTQIRTITIDKDIHIKYQSHIQDIGWQEEKMDSAVSGTTGQSKRMESIKIQLFNQSSNVHIKYRAYVQGTGWQDYVQDGTVAGTTDQSKRIEAVQINLEGIDDYVVEYRVYLQNKGWQVWASNGMIAGTINQYLRIEAIQIRIVKKENTVVPGITYSSHVNDVGWTENMQNGATSGILGKTVEAMKINLNNNTARGQVKYKVHVASIGWKDYVKDGEVAGTTGQTLAIEAIKIKLDGLEGYSVEYRTYVYGKGWQDWTRDDKISGTTGEGLPIEAIQIRVNTEYYSDENNSDFEDINESKYPGYKESLRKLQDTHPNWTIKLVYTGLDWNSVLTAEEGYSYEEPYSLTQAGGEWRNYSDTNLYQGEWYKASRKAIAYMMDPRNSMDRYYIFQFQNLTKSSNETYERLLTITKGTYLQNYTKTIVNAADSYNVSAFHLASRMILEQGNNGWSLNGYPYNNDGTIVTVYNYANIRASGKTMDDIIASGSKYAFNNRWYTPETCIYGTAKYIYDNYLNKGQNTKYFEKYNVIVKPYYTNQYMQNIRAANDEGYSTAKALEANGLLDVPYVFLIPVYENMPETACQRPNN